MNGNKYGTPNKVIIILLMKIITPSDWHRRFTQQARWTKDLRRYLFQRSAIEDVRRVLEVGCGTGAILNEFPDKIPLQAGIDIDREYLNLARHNSPQARLIQGDGHNLPYPDHCFDIALCHFLLLWVDDPARVLREMVRVICPGGIVMALAEPDYGGRVDYPDKLSILGEWQMESLRGQGADPFMGRKLAAIFHKAGLESVETGALGGQWAEPPDWDQWESEWAVLEAYLINQTNKPSFSKKLGLLKELDKTAYLQGERVLFVPTFYAWGRV
jgi:SAM-dependent methyltransferase